MADNGLTVNEQIHDDLLRRQIYLSKYTANMQTQMISLLDNSEGDVRRAIEQRLANLVNADGSFASFGQDTNAQLASLANQLYDIRQGAIGQGTDALTGDLQDLAGGEASNIDAVFNNRSPVLLDTVLPDALLLASIVTTEPMQGRVLSDWADGMATDDVNRMMDTIRSGMAQGATTDTIVQDVLGTGALNGADGVTELTRRNAAAITQTAVATTTNEARSAWADANSDVVGDEVWVATLDGDTCPICAALDGSHFSTGDGDQPPAHFNCRCVRVPTLDGTLIGDRPATTATEDQLADMDPEERAQAVADMTGQVPASMTYQDWLGRQDADFQDEVLGPARGDMFRNGMPLSRFVNRQGDTLTLDELNAKGASTLFVSPNINNLSFDEAVQGVTSARQQAILDANAQIDQMLGVESNQASVIGAWADGAENSTVAQIAPGTDWETMKASAAMKGEIADQKAVLLFQEGNGEGSFLGQFNLSGDLNDIHANLLKDGLPFHTLEQLPDGTVRVYVFGQDQEALDALNKAGALYGKEVEVQFGKGEFVGSAIQEGSDATIRADAINQYEATIRSYLATQPEAVANAWQGVLADWRNAASTLPGIQAAGAAEARQVVDGWIARSGIDTVDKLLANSAENDALLRDVGTKVADLNGATWKQGPIKSVDRIEAKIARGKLPGQITDTVRGSYIVDSPAQADKIISDLAKDFPVADEDWRMTDAGYFDRTVKITFKDGTVGEIQLAPSPLFDAKYGGGHDLYVQWQGTVAKLGADSPDALKLQTEMLNVYSNARNSLSPEWQDFLEKKFGAKVASLPTHTPLPVTTAVGVRATGEAAASRVSAEWVKASPITSVDDLFARARVNDPILKEAGAQIANMTPGVEFRAPGIKGLPRTLEKIAAGRPAAGVTDVVRATFQVPTPAAADKVVADLARKFPVIDEGWRTTPFGYFDRPVKVLFPNGQIGEVLVAPPELVAAKSDSIGGGHGLYKQARSLPAGHPDLPGLADQQKAIYGAARASLSPEWQKVLTELPGEVAKEIAKEVAKGHIEDSFSR